MNHTLRMLMYGQDAFLLELRQKILERAGYAGEIVSTAEEAGQRLQVPDAYWLLMLCHTVPAETKEELTRIANRSGVRVYELPRLLTPEKMLQVVESLKAAAPYM